MISPITARGRVAEFLLPPLQSKIKTLPPPLLLNLTHTHIFKMHALFIQLFLFIYLQICVVGSHSFYIRAHSLIIQYNFNF